MTVKASWGLSATRKQKRPQGKSVVTQRMKCKVGNEGVIRGESQRLLDSEVLAFLCVPMSDRTGTDEPLVFTQ